MGDGAGNCRWNQPIIGKKGGFDLKTHGLHCCRQTPCKGEVRTNHPGNERCSIADTARETDPFCLDVGLGLVSGGKTCVDSQQAQGFTPDPGHELRSPIGGDALWKAVKVDYVVNP